MDQSCSELLDRVRGPLQQQPSVAGILDERSGNDLKSRSESAPARIASAVVDLNPATARLIIHTCDVEGRVTRINEYAR